MPHEGARIYIPDDGDAMALQILLRGLVRAPVRGERRKFADDERLDVGLARLLIIAVCAHVADVRIRQAHDLAGVARIGEDFLVACEAGVENDFAAAARASARRAAVKDSPVFERESRANFGGLGQCVLQKSSFRCRVNGAGRSQRSKMVHRPVGKYGFAVNKLSRHRTEHARIV